MAENLGGIYWTADIRTKGLVEGERVINRSTKRAGGAFDGMGRSIQRAKDQLFSFSGVATAVVSALAVRNIVNYADAFTNVQNRLKVVTDSSEELADVTQKVSDIARESRSNLESTAILYSRLARSTDELGISQERILGITSTITKSFTLSGATATEASNAIRQLSQGFAAGALRGEEFNSVAEQAPEILRAVSKETGMAVGELREFAATGGITSEILIAAIENYAEVVDREFAKTTATLGQSFEVARTNVIQYVGELNKSVEATDLAGGAIIMLSNNLDKLLMVLGLVAAVYTGRLGKAIADNILKFAGAQIQAARYNATLATMAGVSRTTAAGLGALSLAAKGVNGAMALLGGPAGAILLAAGALIYFANQEAEASKKANDLIAQMRGVADAAALLTGEQAREKELEVSAQMAEAIERSQSLRDAMADVQDRIEAASTTRSGEGLLSQESITGLQSEYRKLQEELGLTQKEVASLDAIIAILAQRQLSAANAAKKVKKELDAKAYAELTQAIEDQIYKIREGEQAHEIMIALRKANVSAMTEEGQEIIRLIKQRDEEEAAQKRSEQATKDSMDATKKAVSAYDDYVQSLREGQIELKGTEAVREAFIENLRMTAAAAGKSKEDVDALAASYRELWAAQDKQTQVDESTDRVEQLKQEIALQQVRNQLGNDQFEIQSAIMALGENATPVEQQQIANLVAQMQALRAEAALLGPSLDEAFNQTVVGGLDRLSSGLADVIANGASAREVLSNLAGTIATELLSSIIRYWVGRAAAAVLGSTQEATAKTAAEAAATTAALANIAAVTAASVSAGSIVAAAWAPAAIAASIATGGGIAAAAAPIFTTAVAAMGASLAGSAALSGAAGAAFGGGLAQGGTASPGMVYRVNEKEPEMFVSQGQQYLMPNMRGEVMNSKQVSGGGAKSTVIIENHTGAPVTTRDESTSDENIERVVIGSIRKRKGVFKAITEVTTASNRAGRR